MLVTAFLSADDVLVKVAAKDKGHLLRDLSHRAEPAVHVPGNVIAREILKREALGSTGIGGGIAIPHARVPGLAKPFGTLARLKKAIEFEAVDERPVDLVFLLLLPAADEEESRNALASVARKLRDPETVGKVRKSRDTTTIYSALT
jgi:nitrogen PTS system EIIA component